MATIAELKSRKLQVEIERQSLVNEVMKGSLVRLADVEAVVAEMNTAIRSKLMSFPAQVGHLLLGKDDYNEVVRILTKHLNEILADLKEIDYEKVKTRDKKTTRIYFDTKAGNTTRGSEKS
jgi:hypothetical protein